MLRGFRRWLAVFPVAVVFYCGGLAALRATQVSPLRFRVGGNCHVALHVGAPFMTPGWRRSPLAVMCGGIAAVVGGVPRCGGVLLHGLAALRATQVSPLRLADVVAVMWAAVALRRGDMKKSAGGSFRGFRRFSVVLCGGQMSSTLRLRNWSRALPLSSPFCKRAMSMSWCTTACPAP